MAVHYLVLDAYILLLCAVHYLVLDTYILYTTALCCTLLSIWYLYTIYYCSVLYITYYLILIYYILLLYAIDYYILISYIFMLNTITINRMWRFFIWKPIKQINERRMLGHTTMCLDVQIFLFDFMKFVNAFCWCGCSGPNWLRKATTGVPACPCGTNRLRSRTQTLRAHAATGRRVRGKP